MFKIGDKVVYPMHGAGIIISIEEKEVLGVKNKYYIMKMSLDEMNVLIPINNIEALGIRSIIDEKAANKIVHILNQGATNMEKNWSKRYRQNEMTIRNGDAFEIAEIVKNLTIADKNKKLSSGERKILVNAKQLLVSELVLIWGIDKVLVEDKLEKIIENNINI